MVYELEFNKSKGGSDKKDVSDMTQAKDLAKAFLDRDPAGSVEVVNPFGGQVITIYYRDWNTKAIKDVRYETYIIAHNTSYPHTSASSIVEARIKACALMKKENWSGVGIFTVNKNAVYMDRLNDIGYIITNGYRYEYSDFEKKKNYTLNPKTGRISKY